LRPGGEAHRAQHGGRDRARRGNAGLPISGIGGVTTWRDAAEFLALGAGNVQVCTAAMTYGFKIVEEMKAGLSDWMDEKGYATVDRGHGPGGAERDRLAVPQPQLRDQGADRPGRLHQVRALLCRLRGHLHQAIWMKPGRVFEVNDAECVACNLCIDVCPVENCITMERIEPGQVDARTGRVVEADYANWTTHPNNPGAVKAAE
jgi:dihydropyrimidine dehydrogenase (NAD+) subunit PreA